MIGYQKEEVVGITVLMQVRGNQGVDVMEIVRKDSPGKKGILYLS